MLPDTMWQIVYQQNLCFMVYKDNFLALGHLQNHTLQKTTPDIDFKAMR
jgi:hypothetical protein